MKVFISGTDTNIGKTIISSWLTLHTGFAYFKPIQTGIKEGSDSCEVKALSKAKVYQESFKFYEPVSPHLAARIENIEIDIDKIILPQNERLIIEGAGGLMVPINAKYLMVDLIKKFQTPVILVAHTRLGTINHTLLSLEALKSRDIHVLGVIMNGEHNNNNKKAIEYYGNVEVIAEFPWLDEINEDAIKSIALSEKLTQILIGKTN